MLTKVGRVGARLDHMTGDLHPHGQNSSDIPMSLCTNFFHTPIPLPKGHRMAGSSETRELYDTDSVCRRPLVDDQAICPNVY